MNKEVFSKLPKSVVFAADVGGTNTNIGLCSVKGKKVILHVKYRFDSQKVSFDSAVKQVLKDAKVKISSACIAAAGPVSPDRKTCQLTNVKWKIDARKLPFKCFLLNDFEALGYAINVLQPKDVKIVRKGNSNKLPIGLIGAGTGLGKTLLYYYHGMYYPKASEGGHADLPLTAEESELLIWSNKSLMVYEDVLSGRGIVTLYKFMLTKYEGSGSSNPAEIMKEQSPAAENTRKQFIKFYARCAKNFALDGLTRGGVFIAGGIATKNLHLFNQEFVREFLRNKTYRDLLEKIPIKIITNYNVSLLGAAFASLHALV
jgi:glucokinase